MQYSELISGLASEVGIAGLVPDEDGIVSLDIDGMIVVISEVGDGEALVLRGDAGYPPPEGIDILRKTLLEGNFALSATSGELFAADPENGRIVLTAREPLATLTIPAFVKRLEVFLSTLESWRRIIADFRPAADSSSAPSVGEYMRV